MNFNRASRESGIRRHTLIAWNERRDSPSNVQTNPPDASKIAELEAKLRGNFTERANTVRFAILDRIHALIPNETDLEVLTGTLKEISNDSRLERGQATEVTRQHVETVERPIPDRAKQAIADSLAREGIRATN